MAQTVRSLIEPPRSPYAEKSRARIANGLIKAIAVTSFYLSAVHFPVQASVGPIGLTEDIRVAISGDENEGVRSCINGNDLVFSEDQIGWKISAPFFPERRTFYCRSIAKTCRNVHMNEPIRCHSKDLIKLS